MTKSYKTIQENCIFTTFFKNFLDPQEINSKDPSFARDQKRPQMIGFTYNIMRFYITYSTKVYFF